jgi:hypothetical protein
VKKRSKQIKGPHHYHIKGKQAVQEKSLSHLPTQTISDHGISAIQPQKSPGGQLTTPNSTEHLSNPI